jgi:hypothetical protein
LAQHGVCRHRAFAFLVTAQALGFRVRAVNNEAHAWVEVFDGEGFSRIDLGGAAPELSPVNLDREVPLYEPEPDPFAWPLGQVSGHEVGRRMRVQSATDKPSSWPGSVSSTAPGLNRANPDLASPEALEVDIRVTTAKARRGALLEVSGSARKSGRICRRERVDIFLERPDSSRELLGSVLTDAEGKFVGQVTLGRDAPLGQANLVADVPGACAQK